MADDVPPFPAIAELHLRHFGIDQAVAAYYAEGAAICMHRHHRPPKAIYVAETESRVREYVASWDAPSERQMANWNNEEDGTRDAAYGVVVAAAEVYLGLFVVGRAPKGSGSDYLFDNKPYDEMEDSILNFESAALCRLEVKGRNHCNNDARLDALAREAVEQLERGNSALPGWGGAIAFNLAQVRFRKL